MISINKQSSIRIHDESILYFDPLEWDAKHDADYIFITHPHYDHFSLLAILELKKEHTMIITTKDVVEELLSVGILEEDILVVQPNKKYNLKNLSFETIPAYNLHKKYHPKSNGWVGYLVNLHNVVYYVAGDTDVHAGLKEIKCDVIFLPVGGLYTMDAIEAASLANTIMPKIAIPIHYGYAAGSVKDALIFKKRLSNKIKCKLYY